MTCDRCGQHAAAVTGSFFNTEVICPSCERAERAHPDFEFARRVETEHARRGEFNFPGVGLPRDLRRRWP